jgi:hypothetical protein
MQPSSDDSEEDNLPLALLLRRKELREKELREKECTKPTKKGKKTKGSSKKSLKKRKSPAKLKSKNTDPPSSNQPAPGSLDKPAPTSMNKPAPSSTNTPATTQFQLMQLPAMQFRRMPQPPMPQPPMPQPATPQPPTPQPPTPQPPTPQPPTPQPPLPQPPTPQPPTPQPPQPPMPQLMLTRNTREQHLPRHPQMQHPPMQHPPMQHPPTQHPLTQHPPTQHPPTQHPSMQHSLTKLPLMQFPPTQFPPTLQSPPTPHFLPPPQFPQMSQQPMLRNPPTQTPVQNPAMQKSVVQNPVMTNPVVPNLATQQPMSQLMSQPMLQCPPMQFPPTQFPPTQFPPTSHQPMLKNPPTQSLMSRAMPNPAMPNPVSQQPMSHFPPVPQFPPMQHPPTLPAFMAPQLKKAQLRKWACWEFPSVLDLHSLDGLLRMSDSELKEVRWLEGTSLEAELTRLAPAAEDFQPGTAKPFLEKYLDASKQIFRPGRTFLNIYQAKQHAFRFLSSWGIHMLSTGPTFECHYRARPAKKMESAVSPSRQRKSKASSISMNCPFKLSFHFLYRSSETKIMGGRAFVPVQLARGNILEHTCNPSAQVQADARQRSGFYTKSAPISIIKPLLSMKPGMLPARLLRSCMQKILPAGVPITSTQVNNFRLRLVGMSLKDDLELQPEVSRALAECRGLDSNELELLNNDISLVDAHDILHSLLNEPASYWRVEQLLRSMKANDKFFEYDIMHDQSGCPIGVVWTTKTQREYFVRFGETLSLDAKKKKLNKLSWDLISAVVVDENHSPRSACEGLFVQEDIAGYAFLVRFLLHVETRRTAGSISAIWSDGILQPSFLSEAGLSSNTTVLLLDMWHLINKVWPEYFGAHYFKQVLQGPMGRMCNALSAEAFETAYHEVQQLLANDPRKAEYVAGYANERQRFAAYCLQTIPGTLGRRGSTASEQTHSSIDAHLGDFVLAPEAQIEALIQRQRDVLSAKLKTDRQYASESRILASQSPQNHPDKVALVTLARRPFQKYWCDRISLEAKNYEVTELETSYRVQRKGCSVESARTIGKHERCNCNDRVQYLIQCRHEYSIDRQFVAEKFDFRHFQATALPLEFWSFIDGKPQVGETSPSVNDDTFAEDNEVSDFGALESTSTVAASASVTASTAPADEVHRGAMAELCGEHTTAPEGLASCHDEVGYKEIARAATEFSNLTSRAQPEVRRALYGSMLSLLEVARTCKSERTIHEAIAQAIGCSLAPQSQSLSILMDSSKESYKPIPGETSNQGRPRMKRLQSYATTVMTGAAPGPRAGSKRAKQCGFCSETGHTISGCQKLRRLGGRQLEATEKAAIAIRLNSPASAQVLPIGIVTPEKPLLESMPSKTRFIVLHKQCFINSTLSNPNEKDSPANLGIVVTCLNEFGNSLSSSSEVEPSFEERLVRTNAVVEWINKKGDKGSKLKVISCLDIDLLPRVPAVEMPLTRTALI